MTKTILIVRNNQPSEWMDPLGRILVPLAVVEMMSAPPQWDGAAHARFDLILLDVSLVSDASALVAVLGALRPKRRVVVMMLAGTWEEARVFFRAGALDCISLPVDSSEIYKTVERALAIPLRE